MDSMKNLLHQILPPSVADKLSNKEEVPPEAFDSVTIYFSGRFKVVINAWLILRGMMQTQRKNSFGFSMEKKGPSKNQLR